MKMKFKVTKAWVKELDQLTSSDYIWYLDVETLEKIIRLNNKAHADGESLIGDDLFEVIKDRLQELSELPNKVTKSPQVFRLKIDKFKVTKAWVKELDQLTSSDYIWYLDVETLEKIIRLNNKAHADGESLIGDDLFEVIKDRLQELDPNNPVLKKTMYKTCPPGKRINPKTGRCINVPMAKKAKTCPPGKMINPKTGRCINVPMPKKAKTCPPGKMINPITGRCINVPMPKKAKTCPPGKMINPITGRCIKFK